MEGGLLFLPSGFCASDGGRMGPSSNGRPFTAPIVARRRLHGVQGERQCFPAEEACYWLGFLLYALPGAADLASLGSGAYQFKKLKNPATDD